MRLTMQSKGVLFLILAFSFCSGCQSPNRAEQSEPVQQTSVERAAKHAEIDKIDSLSPIEKSMLKADMVDVRLLNPSIQVFLRYAGDSNFLNKNIYGHLSTAYLADECAKKLALAQTLLRKSKPDLSLLVWDAARPVSCQQLMWDAVDFPVEERTKYVSNPKNHSLHNYGCAVDVTITDTLGNELDMGTEFDDFDTLAQPAYEWKCLQSGALSEHQLNNRKLLRSTMLRAGFRQLPSEWWHYNCCSREYAKQNFEVVE